MLSKLGQKYSCKKKICGHQKRKQIFKERVVTFRLKRISAINERRLVNDGALVRQWRAAGGGGQQEEGHGLRESARRSTEAVKYYR